MMMRNEAAYKNIIKILKDSEDIYIFPHILPDGDAIGSSTALCRALIKLGKNPTILVEDGIPKYLEFLVSGIEENIKEVQDVLEKIKDTTICIAIDSSDEDRMGSRLSAYKKGCTINIDHHYTNNLFAEHNYVDDGAGATGEIILSMIKSLDVAIDKEIGEAIYTAISTDTGSFKYTNTTSKTHIIAAELLDLGIDLNAISIELYQNTRLEKITLQKRVLETLTTFHHGQAAYACVTMEMMEEIQATVDETEGLIEMLRDIEGVEVAIIFKELEKNNIKVGLRAKKYFDVSKVAMDFNGGGHVKAAGCTIYDTLENAIEAICKSVVKYFE
ncbi:MAG: bifunctional oligoribonuclease/PAP phosphatase NrnA [Peptostreptococcales bacterium]